MPKYLFLSIPLAAALVVGLIAYQVTLSSLNPPTEAEIEAAPSWKETANKYRTGGGPKWDPKAFEELIRKMEADEPIEDDVKLERKPDARQRGKRKVLMDAGANWREKLRVRRHNAILKARKTGAVWGMVTAALGYAALGVHFYQMGRKQPRQTWRDVLPPGRQPDATPSPDATYDAPEAAEPLNDITDDEAPYEPYEPPIDISELDRAYEEGREDDPSDVS